jgi:hypothetical protein
MAWTFYNSSGEALIEDGAAIAATQAEMETATATGDAAFVTPGRTQYHPGVAKGWGYVTVSGGTPSLDSNYNVAGIVDQGVGLYDVTWATDFSDINIAFIGTSTSGGFLQYRAASVVGTSYIGTITHAEVAHDPYRFGFAAFGDQ